MNKQETMEWIFNYLTTRSGGPNIRQLEVYGDDDGNWSVKFKIVTTFRGEKREEWAEGWGNDFAEAFENAVKDERRSVALAS
jgi:hypothetical protein